MGGACPRVDGDPEPQNGGPLSRPLGVPMRGIHTCKSYWVSVVSTRGPSGLRPKFFNAEFGNRQHFKKVFNRTTLKLSQRETFYIFPSCCIATGWFHRSLQSLGFCIHVYKHGVQPFIYCFYLKKKNLFSSYPSLPDILFTQFGAFFLAYSELLKKVCVYVCVCNIACVCVIMPVPTCLLGLKVVTQSTWYLAC